MCIRRETLEKAQRSLAFSRVSKPHTHITHMLRQCTSIVYLLKSSCAPDIIVRMKHKPNIRLQYIYHEFKSQRHIFCL
jgi:hypothetical protein